MQLRRAPPRLASKVCAAATRQRPRTRRALNATFARAAAKNGVVIATEKKLPSVLIDETSMQKILTLTNNIAIVRLLCV